MKNARPSIRKYRRSTNGAFKVFRDAAIALEQVKSMSGPAVDGIGPLTKRLATASRQGFQESAAPRRIWRRARDHRQRVGAGQNAFRLRVEAVSANNIDIAQRASSAAAGALMLYQRARTDQLNLHGAAGRQVITPRRIRLLGSPDLAGYRRRSSISRGRSTHRRRTTRSSSCRRPRRPNSSGEHSMIACAIPASASLGPRAAFYDALIARLP